MDDVNVYKALAKRMIAMVDNKTTDSAAEAYRQPTSVYTDPALLQLERDTIFRDEPQMT